MKARTIAGSVLTAGSLLLVSACGGGSDGGSGGSAGGDGTGKSHSPAASTASPSVSASPARPMAKMPAGTELALAHKGRLTVCRGPAQAPFLETTDTSQSVGGSEIGRIKGFDVEMLSRIGDRISIPPEFDSTFPIDQVLDGTVLNRKVCDVVGGISPDSPSAFPQMSFSVPYFTKKTAILVKGDKRYTSLDQLAGKQVGTTTSSGLPDDLDTYNTKHSKKIVVKRIEFPEAVVSMLLAGQVDAVVIGNGVAKNAVAEHKDQDLHVTAEFGKAYQARFAVRKGNTALLRQINAALADAGRNGQYAKSYRLWFGEEPPSVPTAG
ncbi:transporter substrate-binding domain-containing protein [Streptomyces sp. NPDC005271]|uniref:substrate-binding periplasmic protein n=1 Tax=unclassified Streptomyces TaxID=2593676 RepID=UPI0033AA79D5